MRRRQAKTSKKKRIVELASSYFFCAIMSVDRVSTSLILNHQPYCRSRSVVSNANSSYPTAHKTQHVCSTLLSTQQEKPRVSSMSHSRMMYPKDLQSPLLFAEIARDGQAELLLSKSSLEEYFNDDDNDQQQQQHKELMDLANTCRHEYRQHGIAHIPNFVRSDVCDRMLQEAKFLTDTHQCFYSTEHHTVYQEPHDPKFSNDHPRNALQQSSKWIVDYDRIISQYSSSESKSMSPLVTLYKERISARGNMTCPTFSLSSL